MGIDEHGFLPGGIETIKLEISNRYFAHFRFFREFSHFLNMLKFEITPKSGDDRKVAIAILFTKGLETFQSVYILCSYGLTIDAQSLNRVLFEIVVITLFCSKGENEFKKYIAKDALNRIKWINSALKNPGEWPKEFFKEEKLLGETKAEYEALLRQLGDQDVKKEIKIESMAREVGVGHLYQSFYRIVSEYAHSNPRSLEKYMAFDEKRRMKILWGPRFDEVGVHLAVAIEFMLIMCQALHDTFGKPKEEEIQSFFDRKNEIWALNTLKAEKSRSEGEPNNP
jgi:hypothetical protein